MSRIPVREMRMGRSSRPLLTALDKEHPEWRSLLRLIEAALREAEHAQWARLVPALELRDRGALPLLDGAVINVAPRLIGRWVRHILSVAASGGTDVEPFGRAV